MKSFKYEVFFEPWRREVCNTQHMMAEPLALPFPKDPSTTSPTACRLCVYFVCEMALRKNLDIVACTGTMPSVEPSDSNKRRGTLDAVWYKWEVRPVLLPQQLHCFWLRRSQFRHNKCTLQLDLVSGNFHTYTYNLISNRDFSLWPRAYDLCIWTHKHIPAENYFTHRYCGYLRTKIHVNQFHHKDHDKITLLSSWTHLFA